MKRLAFGLLVVVLILPLLVANAVINFPIDSTYFDVAGEENEWTLYNGSGTASKARDTITYFAGTGSLRLTSTTNDANDFVYKLVSNSPTAGGIYSIDAYIKVEDFVGSALQNRGLTIICYYNDNANSLAQTQSITGNTDGWVFREAQVVCPANPSQVIAYLYAPNATTYYDEVIWGTSSEVNTPTPTNTPTSTATPTSTPTNTPTATATSTPTNTPTFTPVPTVTPGADFYQVDLPSGGTGVVEMKTTAGEIFITVALLLVFSVGLFEVAKDLAHIASKK